MPSQVLIGPPAKAAVATLTEVLTHDSAAVRACAVLALGRIGSDAKPALPAIRKALRDNDPNVRGRAAIALWRVSRQPNEATPALIAALKDAHKLKREDVSDWTVRRLLRTIGEIGRPAKDAGAALLPFLKSPDDGVRWWAHQTLKKVDPQAAKKAGVR